MLDSKKTSSNNIPSPFSPTSSFKKKKISLCKKKCKPEFYYELKNLVPNTKVFKPEPFVPIDYVFSKPSQLRGPHDMIPINFEERTTREVLTSAVIFQNSDDQKKFYRNLGDYKNCNHTSENQTGYQYC